MFVAWCILLNYSSRLFLKTKIVGEIARWVMRSKWLQYASFGFFAFLMMMKQGGQAWEIDTLRHAHIFAIATVIFVSFTCTVTVMLTELQQQRRLRQQ